MKSRSRVFKTSYARMKAAKVLTKADDLAGAQLLLATSDILDVHKRELEETIKQKIKQQRHGA